MFCGNDFILWRASSTAFKQQPWSAQMRARKSCQPRVTLLLMVFSCLAGMVLDAHGEDANAKRWIFSGEHPAGLLLSSEKGAELANQLRAIKILDCRESDLTPLGLLEVINRNLAAAHREERVYNDDKLGGDLDEYVRRDFFGPYGKAVGKLDVKDLMNQINRGSIYDLIENFRSWNANTVGCYSSGIYIGWGRNWPYLLGKDDSYHLKFK